MTVADTVERVLDKVNPPSFKAKTEKVEERIKRGRERLKELQAPRREAIEFTNNNHYAYLTEDRLKLGQLSRTAVSQGGEKPDHRVRLSRDLISPIVKAKNSATTQRVPSYESIPTSPDAEDFSASQLSRKIALGGYDRWRLKRYNKELVWNALVTEEGFIRGYWDSTVGPYVPDPSSEDPGNPRYLAMGEVGVIVYSGLEVGWEPGVDFEQSRWFFIDDARPAEDVEREEGFVGGKLTPDATASTTGSRKREKGSKLVMVTEYLERPCPEYRDGRRLIFANDRLIFPEEPYPLRDHEGAVVDEPCIHRLTYDIDGSSDRGKGLVRSLIESMREFDQSGNKILEWMQLALVPQILAEEGSVVSERNDEPGAIVEHRTLPGGKPPEVVPTPPIPRELFEIQDRAQTVMGVIAHENQVPSQVESAKGIQSLATKDALAWQDFIEDYADVQGRLMRDLLTLVQLHYTEERLVNFRGRTGWENTAEFRGADIRGQTDIRVPPSSLLPRTRSEVEQRIANIAQMFPGYFPPEVLISAMEGGSAEKLIEGYEDDVARANRVISMIRSGTFLSAPERPIFPGEEAIDPETLRPMLMVPGWMPRPFDNIAVHRSVLETWMKTDDWDQLEEAAQLATMQYYNALLGLEARKAQRDAMLQSQMAEELGMANAGRPQNGKPMPSLPSLSDSGVS